MNDRVAGEHGAAAELDAISRAVPMAVFAVDGTVLRANAKFLHLLGYTARELIGKPHALLLPGGAPAAGSWAALCDGEAHTAECARVRSDGRVLWLHTTYAPVFDAHRQLAEIVLTAADFTAAKLQNATELHQIADLDAFVAIVHFTVDGIVTDANAKFLQTVGCTLAEVLGTPHRRFVDPAQAAEPGYQDFWRGLAAGGKQTGTFRRRAGDGRVVWLQASYNPVFDHHGQVFKVVMHALDVTAERLRRSDQAGQIAAINQSHCVITFDLHGTVVDANENFLRATGYRLDEIEGRHHRMFVDPSHAHGPEYAAFWDDLRDGRHRAGEFKRLGKNGTEVWLQASYNPIKDSDGQLFKIMKYATVITREKLRRADQQGQIASIHKALCVVSFGLDGTILDANDNFLDLTGYRLGELRGRHHRLLVDESTASDAGYRAFWDALARGQHHSAEFKRLRKDGGEIWLQASYNPIFDMNGQPFKVVKYATDVTQERLRQADFQSQIAAIQRSQCIVTFDMDGTLLDANPNFLVAMGYELAEVVGCHHRMFVDPTLAASAAYESFWDALRTGEPRAEKCKRLGKDGREVWIQATYNPVFDVDGRAVKVMKIATDVSAEVALAVDFHNAKWQAEHDAATLLPNRVGLKRFVERMLAGAGADEPADAGAEQRTDAADADRGPGGAQRLAFLYLDLDHFKPINDTFGHQAGDHLLRETAERLRRVIGPGQLAARIGGDEFVIAAPDLADEQIDALCQRLIDAVQAPVEHQNVSLRVGLSIGVAVSPDDASTLDTLMRCADVALYRTKGSGRGSYTFFAADTQVRLAATRHLAEEMRHGIKANHFYVDYQPRIDAQTHAVQGLKAMLRWEHPERGRIEAADFMPVAEKSGLIVPLGEWMLRMACETVTAWPGLTLAVAISPTHFFGSDLAQVVGAILAETALPAERLEIEIAERTLEDASGRAVESLTALKAVGVRLVLDEGGSRHIPLARLRALHFDALAIDPRFVADIENETGGGITAREIARLDHLLGQGTPSTARRLTLDLDDTAQVRGWLLAPPLPPPAMSNLLPPRAALSEAANGGGPPAPGAPATIVTR